MGNYGKFWEVSHSQWFKLSKSTPPYIPPRCALVRTGAQRARVKARLPSETRDNSFFHKDFARGAQRATYGAAHIRKPKIDVKPSSNFVVAGRLRHCS